MQMCFGIYNTWSLWKQSPVTVYLEYLTDDLCIERHRRLLYVDHDDCLPIVAAVIPLQVRGRWHIHYRVFAA